MNYKAKIRIPKDTYAYIELDVEDTLDNINQLYKQLINEGVGLEDKEWRSTLDRYLEKGDFDASVYERLSPRQTDIIQELKRAFKRIEYKLK
jgi:hypothetical protein